jgi:ADP-heptose:LPS heptosyltransferase
MNLKDLEYHYGLNKVTIELIVWVHSLFLFFFDALAFLVPRKRPSGDRREILVVKLDAIGDFILWLDFARGLRELYPPTTHRMTLLANAVWADFAGEIPLFDRVLPVERMRFILNPLYRLQVLMRIRREGYHTLIDPAFTREFQFTPPVARVSGVRERIAPVGVATNQRWWQQRISDRWYSRLLPSSAEQEMELMRNAEFLRGLGHTEFRAGMPIYLPPPAPRYSEDPYYVIVPGAGWDKKQWPLENFAALATLIHSETGWQGIVCGGPGEMQLAMRLKQLTNAPLQILTGRTTLAELANCIAGARFLVGNDTSAVHFAAAVTTPAVCILGGGHFGRFFPYRLEVDTDRPIPIPVYFEMPCYGCNWYCIYPLKREQPVPCIANIEVQKAWKTVRRLIS